MSMLPKAEAPLTFPPPGLTRTELVSPRTIAEACALLANAVATGMRVTMLAGATDWIVDRQLLPIAKATPVTPTPTPTG